MRKVVVALALAAVAAPLVGSSCEEELAESQTELEQSQRDLEDLTGENDRRYRAKMRRVKLGMTKQEVRRIMGGPPRDKQVFRSEYGRDDTWYYGTWQLSFMDNSLESKNRY